MPQDTGTQHGPHHPELRFLARGHDRIYGSTTIGERGQVVMPAEARKDFGIEVGDKVIVMKHGMGILFLKADDVARLLSERMARLAELERTIAEVPAADAPTDAPPDVPGEDDPRPGTQREDGKGL
jgi:AbrB family looped-hinge helix DNA binding protein